MTEPSEQRSIAFSTPHLAAGAEAYVLDVLRGTRTSGDGPYTKRCHALLKEICGAKAVLLTPSCTAALELSMMVIGLGPGDEAIMPSFTFSSTANAVLLQGATPVFVDIDPFTLNIDPDQVEAAITPRTRAIVPVHYAGVGCDMDRLNAIAADRGLDVIEDAAQGVGASYKGKPLGSLGRLGTLSFHATKNIGCGEGGALLLNDANDLSRAETMREKGTDRGRFLRGEVDKYTWQDKGSSFLPSELQAAYLLAQLEEERKVTAHRLEIWNRYHDALAPLEAAGRLRRPMVPPECTHNAHIYHVLLNPEIERSELIGKLMAEGIQTTSHYVPLHSAPAGRSHGRAFGDLRVTNDIAGRLLRLPLHTNLATGDEARVVGALEALL